MAKRQGKERTGQKTDKMEEIEIDKSTTVVVPASRIMEYGFMSEWISGSDSSPTAPENKHNDEDQIEQLDGVSDDEKLYRKLRKRATGTSSLASSSTKVFSSATATATGSNGCVECPTVQCPECGSNYYCVLTSLTCTQCPLTYCALKPSTAGSTSSSAAASNASHGGKKNVGAIAGGVVGGVGGAIVIFLCLYFFYYKKYYSKNRLLHPGDGSYVDKHFADDDDDNDGYENGEKKNFHKDSEYDESVAAHVGSSAPAMSVAQGNDYNSSQSVLGIGYDPHNMNANTNNQGFRPPTRQAMAARNSRKPKGINLMLSDETSSISTTAASNILPIAYIPGVKVSTSTNNVRNKNSAATITASNNNDPNGVTGDTSNVNINNGLSGFVLNSKRNNRTKNTGMNKNRNRYRNKKMDDDAKSHITLGSSILGDLDDDMSVTDNNTAEDPSTRDGNNPLARKTMMSALSEKDEEYTEGEDFAEVEEEKSGGTDGHHHHHHIPDDDSSIAGESSNGTVTSSSIGSLIDISDNQTAIRARPNLVQIQEEDEEDKAEEGQAQDHTLGQSGNSNSRSLDPGISFATSNKIGKTQLNSGSVIPHTIIEEESETLENGDAFDDVDDDDDDDSLDIGLDIQSPSKVNNPHHSNISSEPDTHINSSNKANTFDEEDINNNSNTLDTTNSPSPFNDKYQIN